MKRPSVSLRWTIRTTLLQICRTLAEGLLCVMVLLLFLDILLRYLFGAGTAQLVEAYGVLFAWLASIALPLSVEHLRTDRWLGGGSIARAALVVETAIVAGLGLAAGYAAIDQMGAGHRLLMLDVSTAWSVALLPFGALVAAFVILTTAFENRS